MFGLSVLQDLGVIVLRHARASPCITVSSPLTIPLQSTPINVFFKFSLISWKSDIFCFYEIWERISRVGLSSLSGMHGCGLWCGALLGHTRVYVSGGRCTAGAVYFCLYAGTGGMSRPRLYSMSDKRSFFYLLVSKFFTRDLLFFNHWWIDPFNGIAGLRLGSLLFQKL